MVLFKIRFLVTTANVFNHAVLINRKKYNQSSEETIFNLQKQEYSIMLGVFAKQSAITHFSSDNFEIRNLEKDIIFQLFDRLVNLTYFLLD